MSISKEELKNEITKIVKEKLNHPHYKVFFFGSRAAGTATSRSDYDIGILADQELSGSSIVEIKDALNKLRVLQKFDVVDFSKISKGFEEVALQNIEVIYEK